MKSFEVYARFIETLEEKIPKKTDLARFIADTLNIEKESAYRRLRGDIQFSFREIFLLAYKMNFSLDKIAKTATFEGSTNLLSLPNTTGIREGNSALLIESVCHFLRKLTLQPYSEWAMALSGIAFPLYQHYSLISRFFVLKHIYHNGNPCVRQPFEEVRESEKVLDLREEFYTLLRNINHTYYIWDNKITPVLVNDINYFRNIHILTEAETQALKEDLICFFDELEQLAITGEYKETGNTFEFYISDVDIDSNYAYLWSENLFRSFYTAFIFITTISTDEIVYESIRDWIHSLKRCSTRISVINDRERTLFFDKQRKIVNTL
jgi:hypothetical protein